jgi:hypothetical protein
MAGVFAVVGVVVTAGVGYVYATNSELVNEFWSVKEDFRSVPPDRRTEVFAELPARITFEKEVRKDMQDLPQERQRELYVQLAASRDTVFAQFKQRISAEAAIARAASGPEKAVAEVTKKIEQQLGKVNVGIDMTSKPKVQRTDPLAQVQAVRGDLAKARLDYGYAHENGGDRVEAAVGVLNVLDRLGDEVIRARTHELTGNEKGRLDDIITDAKATLYDIKQTPGLMEDAKARELLRSIPPKLNE